MISKVSSHPWSSMYPRALRLMLRPIVRFSLRNHKAIQDFIQILKEVYVEVADEELRKTTTKVNPSRLSLLTGLHRKDLNAILHQEVKAEDDGEKNLVFRIIGQWEQDKRFTTKDGKPRLLSFRGPESEFQDLVYSVSRNLTTGTVLFELERIGAVEKSKRGLKLLSDRQTTTKQDPELFGMLAADVENLMESVLENYEDQAAHRNLHLTTLYDNLVQDELGGIREWFVTEGKLFHKRAREFLSQYDLDVNPLPDKKGGGKFVFTTFSRSLSAFSDLSR